MLFDHILVDKTHFYCPKLQNKIGWHKNGKVKTNFFFNNTENFILSKKQKTHFQKLQNVFKHARGMILKSLSSKFTGHPKF